MSDPRERLIRALARMQELGERSLFLLHQQVPPPATARMPGSAGRGDHLPPAVAARLRRANPVGAASSPTPAAPNAPPSPAAVEADSAPAAGGVATFPPPWTGGVAGSDDPELEARWLSLEGRIRACTACRLCETRTQAVPGSGTRLTRLFAIGEGPGADEDRKGEAFVGAAGQLLTKILGAIGFGRDQVYITNVVRCRPPGNRVPLPDEISACSGYLEEQLEIVQPVVILTLGACATQAVLGITAPISKLRGRVHLRKGIPVVPTYHPAALLRSPQYKRPAWEDVQLLRRVYDERVAAPAAPVAVGGSVFGVPSSSMRQAPAGHPLAAPVAAPAPLEPPLRLL